MKSNNLATEFKYIAILDDQKKEVKSELATIDDIFGHAEVLNKIVAGYDLDKKSLN